MSAETESSVGKRIRDALRFVRDGAMDTAAKDFNHHVEQAHRALQGACGEAGEVTLAIATNRINLDDEVVYRSEAQDANLAFDLFKQGLRRITFQAGIQAEEVSAFIRALAECRDATSSDVDFISTLWQEELAHVRYVAIDGFTEKLFMSEEIFTRRFRGAIEDVMPGLLDLQEEDDGDKRRRQYAQRDDYDAYEAGDAAEREAIRGLERLTAGLNERLRSGLGVQALDHLVRLLGSVLVKDPQPIDDRGLAEILQRIFEGYLEAQAWEGFAAAARSLHRLVEARNGFRPAVAKRLEGLRPAVAGGPLAELVGRYIAGATRPFGLWARWFFTEAAVLTAPELLAAINGSESAEGTEFLKDLLHRQGTASLDPWAERLRDPNPGVVLEVLEVILQSSLGEQARPLLMECLKNPDGAVRARAAAGVARAYDLQVREVLLPLLKDEAAVVRKEVLHRFVRAGDKSVSPYLASCIRGGAFGGYDEDEQRMFFEGLARLGGPRFLDVFRERLRLEGDGGAITRLFRRGQVTLTDDPLRRGALSGLALMGVPEAKALIREVQERADLSLAGHCDVVVRLSARDSFTESAEDAALRAPQTKVDLSAGKTALGERYIFEPADVLVPPPPRPRPAGATEDEAVPVVAAPSRMDPRIASLPLSDRPLLAAGERFEPADVRDLTATPSVSQGKKFRLTSPRASLVGVAPALLAAAAPVAATPAAPRGPLAAGPIEERMTPAAGLAVAGLEQRRDPTHPPVRVADDRPPPAERPVAAPPVERAAPPPRIERPVERVASPPVERPVERVAPPPVERPVERPAERVTPPPVERVAPAPAARPAAASLQDLLRGYLDSRPPQGMPAVEASEPPAAAPPPPVAAPPPVVAAPAPPAPPPPQPPPPPPPPAAPAERPARDAKAVEDLLKGFLDLDLGD